MSITVSLNIEEPGSYTTINLYRDTSPDGSFSTLAGTTALVAAQLDYTFSDADGTANSWYRYTLYDSVNSVESAFSEPFRPLGLTLLTVRLEAARRAGAGFDGTTTTTATDGTYLQDATLIDAGIDAKFLESAWVYFPNAAAADRMRRVKPDGFDPATGKLSWDSARAVGTNVASGTSYQVFLLLPPKRHAGFAFSWDDAVREGMQEVHYVDRVQVATTDGLTNEYDLGPYLGYVTRDDIRNVYLEWTDGSTTLEANCQKLGKYIELVEDGEQNLKLRLFPVPAASRSVIVEANRQGERLWLDTDITTCPEELAYQAARWRAFAHLEHTQHRYKAELGEALQDFNRVYYGASQPDQAVHL